MAAFRKLPVEIEAVRWDGTNKGEVWVLFGGTSGGYITEEGNLLIRTLEGTMAADVGDWIIRGVKGGCYPCKPDIFAATYEPVA